MKNNFSAGTCFFCLVLFLTLSYNTLFFVSCSDDDDDDTSGNPTPTATPTEGTNTAPDTFITDGPVTATSFPIVFSFSGQDAEDDVDQLTYSFRIDAEDWSSFQAETQAFYSSMSDGPHTFEVKARDTGGLEDESPATWSFTVNTSTDQEPPETFITVGPEGTVDTTEIYFEFSGTDNETSTDNLVYSFLMDSGEWTDFSSGIHAFFDYLGEGEHTFYVKAQDEVGTIDPTPATRTFTITLAGYGISLSPFTATQYFSPGGEAEFTVNIENTGSFDGSFTFELFPNLPADWNVSYCLSDGTCVVGPVSIPYSAGQTDFMIIHIFSSGTAAPGDQGSAKLVATCDQDTSVTSESNAIAVIQTK